MQDKSITELGSDEDILEAIKTHASEIQAFTHGPVWALWVRWSKVYADGLYKKAVEGVTPEIREEARVYWQAYKKFSAIPFAMVSELEAISQEVSPTQSE